MDPIRVQPGPRRTRPHRRRPPADRLRRGRQVLWPRELRQHLVSAAVPPTLSPSWHPYHPITLVTSPPYPPSSAPLAMDEPRLLIVDIATSRCFSSVCYACPPRASHLHTASPLARLSRHICCPLLDRRCPLAQTSAHEQVPVCLTHHPRPLRPARSCTLPTSGREPSPTLYLPSPACAVLDRRCLRQLGPPGTLLLRPVPRAPAPVPRPVRAGCAPAASSTAPAAVLEPTDVAQEGRAVAVRVRAHARAHPRCTALPDPAAAADAAVRAPVAVPAHQPEPGR
ncbi:hypothetical protein BD413DRAFT_265848 [Trametes elegans]|nr:hypothetical protein BD413DRAFT_265848 [Trametes elegans]